jgi:hypothetical protein
MRSVLYDYLHGQGDLGAVRSAADFDALCAAAAEDTAGRLRWKLDRVLGLAPWAGQPGRDEYLYALANLRLDRAERLDALCPACRANAEAVRCACCGGAMPTVNPGFDEGRYEELKHDGPASL